MDPRDFLNLANELLKDDKPSNNRTAISRSYYAAYNVAVHLLEKSSANIQKNTSGHGEVKNYLGNCGIKDLEEAQSKLTALHGDRIKADYRLKEYKAEKKDNAVKAVLTSKLIIDTFDRYNSREKRKNLAKGVEIYEQKISPASKGPSKP